MYPALGGDCPRNFVLTSMQALVANVTGITGSRSGLWIQEARPEFDIEQLAKFFNHLFLFILPINIEAIMTLHTTWPKKKIANHAIIWSNQIKIPKQGHLMVVKNAYK